jgi:protein transport protein YIF1
MIVLCPFLAGGEWTKTQQEHHQDHMGFLAPKLEIHAPDLYIPLMSFMTFVLLACVSLGDNFTPNLIGSLSTKCIFLSVVEMLIIKASFPFI